MSKKHSSQSYIRKIGIGLVNAISEKVELSYAFESGTKTESVIATYPMAGNERYLNDMFVDDMPDKRVELNTDRLPRYVVKFKGINIKSGSYANPNAFVTREIIKEENLIRVSNMAKFIPVKLSYEIKAMATSELELYMLYEGFVKKFWPYKYFSVEHDGVQIRSVMEIPDDIEFRVPEEIEMTGKTTYEQSINVSVTSQMPIHDEASYNPNGALWTVEIKEHIKKR